MLYIIDPGHMRDVLTEIGIENGFRIMRVNKPCKMYRSDGKHLEQYYPDLGGQFYRIDWSHAPIKVIEAARGQE